ncbi:MAG: beta-propeller fold lactonase family protein [Isosphaeraceae bacterium]
MGGDVMLRMHRWGLVLVIVIAAVTAKAADRPEGGRLKLVEAVVRDDLDSVVKAVVSPDGRFVYATSWKLAKVLTFARDQKSGKLTLKQTISDPENLAGVTGFALSPDGHLAIAAAFRSKTAVLYLRDPGSGLLGRMDIARDDEAGVRLDFPVEAAFAPDSRGVTVLDDAGVGEDLQGSVVSFRVEDGKLVIVGTDTGKAGCYAGGRGLAFHPDGKTLFVACNRAGTLVVADRDPIAGWTKVRQVIKDDERNAHGLAGAMGVVVSRDGRHVYVNSGRFEGDNAVSVFRFGTDGRLSILQEFINGQGILNGFEGGNHLTITPDGLNVYAVATRSGTIACFGRDPASGKLTLIETIPDGAQGNGLGADSASISPDGRFVYVPTEDKMAISVFRRD